jgi:hypothetical protein
MKTFEDKTHRLLQFLISTDMNVPKGYDAII